MKFSFKRILSFAIALVMILGLMPTIQHHAHAATGLTTSVEGLTASWEYSSTNENGTGTTSGNGITLTATGGRLNTTKIVLTLTNNLGTEATLKFNWVLAGKGTLTNPKLSGAITASEPGNGAYEGTLADGGYITITFESPRNAASSLAISDISLISTTAADPTITFKPGANGSYTVNGTVITKETQMTVAAGTDLALVATPASGYQFYAWQKADGTFLSQDASYTMTAGKDETITPVFISASVALFGVGSQKFDDLTEAGAAAAAGSTKTIILLNNGTVSGSHTIPAGTTLLIPYDDANTQYGGEASCTSYTSLINSSGHIAWVSPTAYRTLTLAADANITVNGNIEVGGRHAAAGGANGMYGGSPTGKLGYINMLSGSHIDLNSGANLYCWGYIYGEGTITAKNGASIYENFQIQDFRGGSITSELAANFLVFPLSQYYVQNVEVATRYEYGATEYIATSIFMSYQCHSATVKFIGTDAMFQPASGSYFIKDYNPATDMLEMHAYGDSTLSSMNLELGGTAINSSDFVLPITNNMQIYLHSGTTTLQQNMMMLPGSSLTIDQGATLNLAYTDVTGDVVTAGGHVLQIFDSENWTTGLNQDTLETVTGLKYVHPSKLFQAVPYTCTARKTRTAADLTDVTIDINGTVITNGFLYSTVTWKDVLNEDFTVVSGGANIISSGKTGVVAMNNGAGQDMLGYMFDQSKATYYFIPLASVQLKNGDGTLVDTTGAAAGTTYNYCVIHDCWYTGECEKCNAPVNIKWMNGTTVIYKEDVDNGSIPFFKGTEPTKAPDADGHYTFAGWTTVEGGTTAETLGAVTADTTYYAVFTTTAHADTTTKDHKCDNCSYVMSVCSDITPDGDHSCDTCGKENVSSHADTTPIDHYCDDCGNKISEHEMEVTTAAVAPGCETPGATAIETCTKCGYTTGGEVIPATDHDMQLTAAQVDATCETDGKTAVYTCANGCGKTEGGEVIPATGHAWGDPSYTDNKNGTHTASYVCGNDDSHTKSDEAAAHVYDETAHKCVCGDVEKFTLKIDYWDASTNKEIELAYGEKLPEIATNPVVVTEGKYFFVMWKDYDTNAEVVALPETMPAEDLHYYAAFAYTGWLGSIETGRYFSVMSVEQTGWICVNEQNELVTDGSGSWYYADPDTYKIVTGITRVPYPTDLGYAPDQETLEYCENKGITFIDAETGLFVFGEDGKFQITLTGLVTYEGATRYVENGFLPWHPGFVTVDGELYYFIGDETVGGNIFANGDIYIIRANGVANFAEGDVYNFTNGQFTGLNGIYDGKYYENSKLMVANGLTAIEVDGETKYIYVNSYGKLIICAEHWVDGSAFGIVSGVYVFDENGYMTDVKTTDKNGIFFEDGAYFYYVDGVKNYAGLIQYTGTASDGTEYNNDWIYVRWNGELATGEYWITKTNDKMDAKLYLFDETGAMVNTSGIIKENGSLYYYEDGILQKGAGLINIDGNYYYVKTSGEVVNNTSYWITNVNETGVIAQKYTFDENGVMQNPAFEAEDDVTGVVNGYYYVNGEIAYGAGLIEWEGDIYYVRSNGQVATGEYWPTTLNGLLPEGKYNFGEDGKLITE